MEQKISFEEAKKKGLKYYFTGLPCDNGHISKRRIYRKSCVACDDQRRHRRLSKIENHLWDKLSMARYHSKKKSKRSRGINFSREEFLNWLKENYKGYCNYCGISLEEFQKKKSNLKFKVQAKKFGIDRKNSMLGYTIDNIAISCSVCNTAKTFLFDEVEFKEIAQKYIRKLYDKE
ncbi:hypothetical protein [Candidatus Pelagibacter sp. HIMB123]|uniref:hypothetical protein n=1 Tax=Candidatus Pelagibacter sp. HIMB123 TaxID=3415413 RepID=UPI003F82A22C